MHAKHADAVRLNGSSGRVIGCAFTVLNTLGTGFLEKVYDNALAHEVRVVGQYGANMLVEQALLVELKSVRALDEAHRAQCVNHLKASYNSAYC